jgi:predicted dinucleotide-binding enzyme
MRISIVGAGNVGGALAPGWRDAGHTVQFALRDPDSASARAAAKSGFQVAPLAQAAGADVLVLAVPWASVESVVRGLGTLMGKILVDATNPLTP